MGNENIFCPLVEREISCVECMENTSLKSEAISEQYKAKKEWKEICNSCPYNKF